MSENWYDSKKKQAWDMELQNCPNPGLRFLQLHWIRRKTRPVLKDRARKPAGVFRKSSNKIERGHMRARALWDWGEWPHSGREMTVSTESAEKKGTITEDGDVESV